MSGGGVAIGQNMMIGSAEGNMQKEEIKVAETPPPANRKIK
jgi:hypothetical protein